MTAYSRDRRSADYIYKNIEIIPSITPLNWQQIPLDEGVAEYIDIENRLDYFVEKQESN